MDDEEGNVVYFQTSPALEGCEKSSDEFAFADSRETESFGGGSISSRPAELERGIWSKVWCTVTQCLKIAPDSSHKERECCRDISTAIRDSPLLTEEDYRLLYFALLEPHPQKELTNERPLGNLSKWAVMAVLVSLLAVCLATQQVALSVSLPLLASSLLCLRAVFTRAISAKQERGLVMVRQMLADYCSEMEALLSLLSHCLRTIQEAELVTRQFTRPLVRGAPANREGDGSTHYYSVGLRCSLFSVCQTMIERLRNATFSLSQQHPLNRELDGSIANHLAHSPLSSLHTHLTTNLDNISREERRNHKCLSQESLKNAANLLAVQNSEFLCHMALSLLSASFGGDSSGHCGTDSGPDSGPHDLRATLLKNLVGSLTGLREGVVECRLRLQWSCDFHRNHLLGDPPERLCGSTTPPSLDDPLTQLAREVHSMDVKTQAALQRIRDLGNLLAGVSNTVVDPIPTCEEDLSVVQRVVDAVSDQIEDSLGFINTLQHPSHSDTGGVRGEGSGVEDTMNEATGTASLPLDHLNRDTSSSSEDEKVFEGCAGAQEEDDTRDANWREGGGEVGKREREVSTKMVTELEGVLAVRSERREREREERRRKRRQRNRQTPPQPGAETQNSGDLATSEHKENSPTNPTENSRIGDVPSKSADSQEPVVRRLSDVTISSRDTADEPPPHPLTSDGSLPPLPTDGSVGEDELPGVTSQLAQRVASIAASRRRGQTEETFGSDSDSSHSEQD